MANVRRNNLNNRKLISFPEECTIRSRPRPTSLSKKHEDVSKLVRYIDDNIIGKSNAFYGPFGRRKVVFCDYTASGRSLQFIEDYILKEVLPSYGNTHSTTTITSLQSALFRQEARDIIRGAVNGSEQDVVIFSGHGSTGALHKLMEALGLQEPPIVFVGSSEHHSNLVPWRDIGAKIVRISETKEGFLDLCDLEDQLQTHQNSGRQLIGCFCNASNITGVLTDDVASTILLHQYRALSFWDYTIAAPCATIDMNPEIPGGPSAHKDAIFFAGHKFIGGVQTPGILVAKKSLFNNSISDSNTRGTYFSRDVPKSVQDLELKEEGGTAAVVESIRAGLVMQLKETVGVSAIMQRAEKVTKQMMAHIRTIPEVILLGNGLHLMKRLPIFSFMVRHPRGTFLHHNFVCAILNDVFGIQARAGCSCAGPYAEDILGISTELASKYEDILLENMRLDRLHLKRCDEHSSHELLRPGFCRLSLPYFMSDNEVAFIMEALKMVATEGWKLLPQYIMVPETGEWRHHTNSICKDRKWLGSIRYVDGKMTMNERRISGPGIFPQTYQDCLQTARNLFNRSRKTAHRSPLADQGIAFDEKSSRLRWFMLPNEAQDLLLGHFQNVKHDVPFDPITSTRRFIENNDIEMISISAPLSSNNSSPRHFSLTSLDEPKFKAETCNTVPQFNYEFMNCHPKQNINFVLGDLVRSVPVPQTSTLDQHTLRERCYSLNNVSPMLSPQTRASLGMHSRQRQCSCSSQTDIHSMESDTNISPSHSLSILPGGSFSDCSLVGRGSPYCHSSTQENDDLQAYVQEVTKELATTIKSELRGVISKVEDVLENSESIDTGFNSYANNDRHGSGSEDGRSDSISVNEVAEYIVEVSKNMANEVKSEIRDVVSAVDVFIAPDGPEKSIYSRASSSCSDHDRFCSGAIPKRISPVSKRLSADAALLPLNKSNSVSKLNDEEHSIDDSKNRKLWPAVGSISSQDSGINLSFHEHDFSMTDDQNARNGCDNSCSKKLQRTTAVQDKMKRKSHNGDMSVSSDPEDTAIKWYNPPKNIWNAALEAFREFNMIRDGDRIMICLTGNHDSLSLLHVLHHYQTFIKPKGINFSFGVALINNINTDNQHPLIPYLNSLNVPYILEEKNKDEETEVSKIRQCSSLTSICSRLKCGRLYVIAKNAGYNVLAVSQHLDDLAEDFLLSLFHSGKLHAMKAHYYVKDNDLRVIRPFVYVREKSLKQFVESRNLPVTTDNCLSAADAPKERHRTKQLLAQQEILFPNLFWSLRTALQPLLGSPNNDDTQKKVVVKDNNSISIYIESDTDEEPVFFTKQV